MRRKFKYLAPSSLRALFVGLALGIGLGLWADTGGASAAAIGSAKQTTVQVYNDERDTLYAGLNLRLQEKSIKKHSFKRFLRL